MNGLKRYKSYGAVSGVEIICSAIPTLVLETLYLLITKP